MEAGTTKHNCMQLGISAIFSNEKHLFQETTVISEYESMFNMESRKCNETTSHVGL